MLHSLVRIGTRSTLRCSCRGPVMHQSTHPILMTMVAAISSGVLLIVLARRLRIPSIVLLLAAGVALGPEGLEIVRPELLGEGLRVLVSLLVGIILFEGGLTLDVAGYREVPRVITRLLTVGVLTTWMGIAVAVWLLGGLPAPLAVVSASLLIVTGPTVVGPLLKRIAVTKKVHHVLQWEGVLIDPIGVFIAILALEVFALGRGGDAFVELGIRVVSGLSIGVAGGAALHRALERGLVPVEISGVTSLATAVLLFGLSEIAAPETGLLTVTVAGFYVGWRRPSGLESIKRFKQEVTELAIGMLFILLSARLALAQFVDFGLAGVAIIACVMFVVRPASVLLSTLGLDVSWKERALLSWIAPRGIVAASMASLLALELEQLGAANPRFVETLTYAVIISTIVVQGFTAGWVTRALGLMQTRPPGWLIVGAHRFARDVARFLHDHGISPVVLIDSNRRHARQANAEGLHAVVADARDAESLSRRNELAGIGRILALTPNEELNTNVCRHWVPLLGQHACHRWQSTAASGPNRQRNGQAVWTTLPSPASLSLELESGEAVLLTEHQEHPGQHALLQLANGSLSPCFAPAGPSCHRLSILLMRRSLDALASCLRRALSLEVTPETRAGLVACALDRVAEVCPRLPMRDIRRDIAEQERTLPASIGHGVAVPHATVPGLGTPLCALVKSTRPVDWDAPDGLPVDIVLVLLSPAEHPEQHIALLAEIARKLSIPEVREALRARPVTEWVSALRSTTTTPTAHRSNETAA